MWSEHSCLVYRHPETNFEPIAPNIPVCKQIGFVKGAGYVCGYFGVIAYDILNTTSS